MLIPALLLLAPLQTSPARPTASSAPTAPAAPRVAPDSTAPAMRAATARVGFDFGGGEVAPISVRSLQLDFSNNAPSAPAPARDRERERGASPSAVVGAAQARFVKDVDSLTSELAQHGASGTRLPTVTMSVADPTGRTIVRVRLFDVVVSADRVLLATLDPSLEQRRLDLRDAIAQASADLQEAQRQAALTDALDKRRLSSSQEVARARERVEVLQTRLDGQQRRLTMLEREIHDQAPVREEVTLTFARFELETP